MMLLCVVGVWVLWPTANGAARDAAGSPYQPIIARNVFGLRSPPPPPSPEANKPPPPKIFLQGITTFGGVKRALLKTQMPPKPGEKPTGDQSFILAEGQRDGDIEVLEIKADGEASYVKVNDFGTITNLTFENNGIKGAPGAVPVPGRPPITTVMAVPGHMPGAPRVPPPFTGRPLRLPGSPGAYSPQGGVPGAGLPGMNTGVNPSATQRQVGNGLGAEGNALMLEANRLRHAEDIKAGRYPPLPRSPLTDAMEQEMNAGASTPTPTPQMTLPLPPGGPRPLPQ